MRTIVGAIRIARKLANKRGRFLRNGKTGDQRRRFAPCQRPVERCKEQSLPRRLLTGGCASDADAGIADSIGRLGSNPAM